MIWFGDKFSISVVDLRDLSQTIIENGLKEVLVAQQILDKNPEPVSCICDFDANKILVVYALEEERILVFNHGNSESQMWLIQEKFPNVQKLTALDVTKDKKFGIAGVIQGGKPALFLFTFDAEMKIVC